MIAGGVHIRVREETGGQAAQAAAQGDGDGDTEEERALSGDAETAQTHTEGSALRGGLQRDARVRRRARHRQPGQHTRVPSVRRRPHGQRPAVHGRVADHHRHAAAVARARVQFLGLRDQVRHQTGESAPVLQRNACLSCPSRTRRHMGHGGYWFCFVRNHSVFQHWKNVVLKYRFILFFFFKHHTIFPRFVRLLDRRLGRYRGPRVTGNYYLIIKNNAFHKILHRSRSKYIADMRWSGRFFHASIHLLKPSSRPAMSLFYPLSLPHRKIAILS